MAGGGIWEAIGAALQAGGQTYNTVSRQQQTDREQAARLRIAQDENRRQDEYQREQLASLREKDAQTQEDRKIAILKNAITNAEPDDQFTPDQFADAKKFGLSGLLKSRPGVDAMPGGNVAPADANYVGPLGDSTSPDTMAFLQSRGLNPSIQPQQAPTVALQGPILPRKLADLNAQPGSVTRRLSPAEEATRAQQEMLRDVYKNISGPQGSTNAEGTATSPASAPAPGTLNPEQKTRLGLSMIPGVNANEIMGTSQSNPFAGNAVGEDVLKSLSPQEAIMVKKMANYELPVPGGNMRSPAMQRLMSLAAAYDPTFDSTQYASRQKVRNDFTSGGVANNIQALNRTLDHMAKLSGRAEELNNFSSPVANAPINYVENHLLGDQRVTNYNLEAQAVATEAAKVFKGGINAAPAEKEIEEWKRNLSPNMSPEQFKGAMQSLSDLLQGQLVEFQNRWSNAFGDKALPFQLPSINAKGAVKEMGQKPLDNGGLPNGIQVVGGDAAQPQPQAKLATVAQINAYAKAKGIQPAVAAKQLQAEGWTINGR